MVQIGLETTVTEGEQEVNQVIRDPVWPGTCGTGRKRNVRHIAAEGGKNKDENESGDGSKSSDTKGEQEINQVIWEQVWPGTRNIRHTAVEGGMYKAEGAERNGMYKDEGAGRDKAEIKQTDFHQVETKGVSNYENRTDYLQVNTEGAMNYKDEGAGREEAEIKSTELLQAETEGVINYKKQIDFLQAKTQGVMNNKDQGVGRRERNKVEGLGRRGMYKDRDANDCLDTKGMSETTLTTSSGQEAGNIRTDYLQTETEGVKNHGFLQAETEGAKYKAGTKHIVILKTEAEGVKNANIPAKPK